MTKAKTTKKLSLVPTTTVDANTIVPVSANILAFNENVLKAVAVYSSALMFSKPQFAAQVTPTNILGLADLMYKYMQGTFSVSQPETNTTTSPTFG